MTLFLWFVGCYLISFSQQNEAASMQACSQCIRYSVSQFETLEPHLCQKVIDIYPKTKAAHVAGLILGRKKMNEGAFQDAIKIFEASFDDDPVITLIINGLLGDCYSELKKYNKALTYYH